MTVSQEVQSQDMLMPVSHPRGTISRAQMVPLERKSLQLAVLYDSTYIRQGTQVGNASR